MDEMKIAGIAPWFGSKRMMAPDIVKQLGPHKYYFEGCAGSMSVLLAKEPSDHEMACDLHGALTNLAWIVQNEHTAAELFNRLQRTLYSDELFLQSKTWLATNEPTDDGKAYVDWAYHYFIASWMGRNGVSGTKRSNYQLATRWTSGGGSGPLRFRSAVESIPAWLDRLRNVQILRRDLFEILPKLEDEPGLAIYCDPPYLDNTMTGNSRYLFHFDKSQHRCLAEQLARFVHARVVVSYYADPWLKELYPGWTFVDHSRFKQLHSQNKRGASESVAPEQLIINGREFKCEASLFD